MYAWCVVCMCGRGVYMSSVGTCVCTGRMWSVCCVHGVCIVYVCNVYVWCMVEEGFVCGMLRVVSMYA